ncbi:MAG: RloB family protein [Candidatus Methanoperedens sp.]
MKAGRRRKSGERIESKFFVIVCEGKVTERIYFDKYRTVLRDSNIKIETPKPKCTDPVNLTKFAIEQIKKGRYNIKTGDTIWCVFDCDENTNEKISKAQEIAGKNVLLCLSNPSFELWYLLHFTHISHKIFRDEAMTKLKEFMPKYEKNIDVYETLIDKREQAIKNAKQLIEMHKNAGIELLCVESNPSTQVSVIVEELLKIAANSSN